MRIQKRSCIFAGDVRAAGVKGAGKEISHWADDAAGNLQTDGLHHYHYDSQGRLQSSQTDQGADAPTTRYAHNALGQRVFKTEPLFAAASGKEGTLDEEEPESPGLLQTLHDFFTKLWNPAKSEAEHLGWAYVYDEEGSLLGEYGMGGAQSAGQSQYLYLPTSQGPLPIAADIDSRLYAIHTDHLGTPRRLTQADGQAAWQWAYSAYGDEAPTLGAQRFTNETTNPTTGSTNIPPVRFNLRYPGQYFDEESGLHYNYFRSYDPRTGRYTQFDPIGLDGGWNGFAYVGGNPLSSFDLNGLKMYPDGFVGPLPPDGYRRLQMTKTRCGLVPPSPPGVDIVQNMSLAKGKINPLWFRNMVRNKGPWDYKQQGPIYQDFGNFNYGAAGRSFGFYRQTLLQEAGRAQQAAGTSRPEWGYPPSNSWDIYGGQPPYGDDPDDQEPISNGADFCQCMGY